MLAFHVLVFFGVVVMRFVLQHVPQTAQGRHMYPALAAIAVFFVLGWVGVARGAWTAIRALVRSAAKPLSTEDTSL